MKNLPSNKNFGMVFCSFFFLLYLYLYFFLKINLLFLLILSLIFFVLGLFNSKILKPLNIIWYYIGVGLSVIISPIILSITYYFIVTPIGFIKRKFNKNYLEINYDKNKKSYWIDCKKKPFFFNKQY